MRLLERTLLYTASVCRQHFGKGASQLRALATKVDIGLSAYRRPLAPYKPNAVQVQ